MSVLYPSFKELLLGADIDLIAHDIRAIIVDTNDYSYSASHNNLDDVAAGARVAVSPNLTGKSITNGVFDADDVDWPTVTGDQSEACILYRHTGTESTSSLICYLDSATGLPVTPNGGGIRGAWDNGANKIFAL